MSEHGPKGCTHALIVKGEHFWCDEEAGHTSWPHGSVAVQTIWGDAAEAAKLSGEGTFTFDELRITLTAFALWLLPGDESGEGQAVELVDQFIAYSAAADDDEPPVGLRVLGEPK
jgi:hypothetical protein